MFNPFFLQTSESLQQVARSFGEVSHRPEETPLITAGILVAAAVLAYLLWKKIRPAAGKHWRTGSTIRPQSTTAILGQALIHRSRMDINFHSDDESRQTVSCTLYDLSDAEIILEMPFGVTPSEAWQGRVMKCFFRIPRPDKAPYFYTFSAPVLRIFRESKIDYLSLAVPQKIELGQKRRHLRLEVPSTDIKDFRVWASADGALPLEEDEANWPDPLAVYASDTESLRILDISGGGIRLAFDPKHYSDLEDFVSKNPVLIMRLELGPAAGEDSPPHYVAAQLRTNMRDAESGALMLGYEFVECRDQNASTFDWIKIDPRQGVDSLVTWIFKRHLELYRGQEIV